MLKGKLAMMIVTAVLIVLGLVSVTLSWYVSQEQVKGENATVMAEESLSASITSTLVEDSKYGGETGKGPSNHDDEPYSVDFRIVLNASAIQETTHLQVLLKNLKIMTGQIEESGNVLYETNTPEENMTIRVTINDEIYLLNNQNYLVKESSPSDFYCVENGENVLIVKVIYLDEVRYLKWEEDNANSLMEYLQESPANTSYFEWLENKPEYFAYPAFEYCLPVFMYTHFYLAVEYITDTIIEG